MRYYARSNDGPEETWQTMAQHLNSTAEMAARFAEAFNAKDLGYMAGVLHDLGKYSPKFQKKLRGTPLRVDHSTAGAQVVMTLLGEAFGKLLAYCISGHHSGLLDHGTEANIEGTLLARLKKDLPPEDYEAY